MGIKEFVKRVRVRLVAFSVMEHIKGLWFARGIDKHGIVVVTGGSPMPKIINHGGEIHTGTCQFYSGVRLEVGKDARLVIGNGTYLNRNTLVCVDKLVNIGNHCKISWDVVIMDSDLHPRPGTSEVDKKPVIIENDVWIGCRCIILKGVHIGQGAVIGAGSVITKDVPPHSIVVGSPQRIVGQIGVQQEELYQCT